MHLKLVRAFSKIASLAPPGAGQYALASRLAARGDYPKPTLARQTMVGSTPLELDLSEWNQRMAFALRRYEPDLIAFLKSRLAKGGVLLDVGANVGLVTFLIASQRPHVTVHAFEPNPHGASRWRRNKELNPEVDARLNEVAVGAAEGHAKLALSADRESAWSQMVEPGATAEQSETLEVTVTTLDRYIAQERISFVDVLKLDVEGYEPRVLAGAARALSERRIGCIISELNDFHLERLGSSREALISWLADQGYSAFEIPGTGFHRIRPRRSSPGELAFAPKDVGVPRNRREARPTARRGR
jgi:FkbM family methyltransferase